MKNYTIFHRFLFKIVFLAAAATSFAQTTVVSLDGNPETEGISPPPVSVIAGETFIIAVTIHNVNNLHSYSVKCLFDSQVVAFNGAAAKLSPLSPVFLETNKGRQAAFLSIPGNGMAEFAATQAGSDVSTCAKGDGILGYLSFTAKIKGNPLIQLAEVRLLTHEGRNLSASIN